MTTESSAASGQALAPDRRPAWVANAVAVAPLPDDRPVIAIVIDDVGIDQLRTRRAIDLPAPLTLAFLAYGSNLDRLTEAARERGHELLVHVNMEPMDPDIDPGPQALLTRLDPAELQSRLEWQLSRFGGYVGINNHMGSRFTAFAPGMSAVMEELRVRQLLFLDSLTNTTSVGIPVAERLGVPQIARDVFLDHDQSEASVRRQLLHTEQIAANRGYAVAIGHPYDVTIAVLTEWLATLEARGFVAVPLSAAVRRKMAPQSAPGPAPGAAARPG